MSRKPSEDEVIEAKVVGGEPKTPEEPKMQEEPAWQAAFPAPRKSSTLAPILFVVGLLVVTVLAVTFRVELVDVYETMVLGISGKAPVPSDGEPVVALPNDAGTPETPLVAIPPETPANPEPPDVELPTFEKIERPPAEPTPEPEIPDLVSRPPDDKMPGYGYSRIQSTDLSEGGVVKYRVKVVVPAHYAKADLLRVAADLVRRQRITRPAHAMRVIFFPDPAKTGDDDASAEIVWAPGGEFDKAAEAVKKGTDDNQYRINMK